MIERGVVPVQDQITYQAGSHKARRGEKRQTKARLRLLTTEREEEEEEEEDPRMATNLDAI